MEEQQKQCYSIKLTKQRYIVLHSLAQQADQVDRIYFQVDWSVESMSKHAKSITVA